uniref:Lipoprotein n=1 Tax=candidate division WOR-3 bacterium TaxID=2052148 RepID=A0A7C4XMZ1_UNCW3
MKRIFIIIPLIFLSCSDSDYNSKLAEYIKRERELRKSITNNQELEDSLKALRKRFGIDLKKELKKLDRKPEIWVRLLNDIDGKQ